MNIYIYRKKKVRQNFNNRKSKSAPNLARWFPSQLVYRSLEAMRKTAAKHEVIFKLEFCDRV